ncbi:MAG: glycosyltransferase [Sphingobacteriales bacterium]|nr:glycosyltransferase [Sphingobacteriales bacterium]
MERDLFFSIIIPAYNRAHMILETLESAFAQTYPHFEVILVDDGSTDNTVEVIRSVTDPRFVYHKKANEERAIARNTGFNLAKGDYVTLLDSDDYFYPNHLEAAANYIRSHKNPEVIRFNYDVVDSNKHTLQIARMPEHVNDRMVNGNFMGCSGIILRRDVAVKYAFNGDRDLSGSEDYELWLRMAARFRVHTQDVITCSLHSHEERSVIHNIKEETLVKRIELLIKYSFGDKVVRKIYGVKKDVFVSHCLLYISLHLAIAQINRSSFNYLLRAIKTNPRTMLDKRFFGIIKTLIKRNILASFE